MGKIKATNCDDIEGLKGKSNLLYFGDSRGYFMETYNYNDFKEAGIDVEFVAGQSVQLKIRCAPRTSFPAELSAGQACTCCKRRSIRRCC